MLSIVLNTYRLSFMASHVKMVKESTANHKIDYVCSTGLGPLTLHLRCDQQYCIPLKHEQRNDYNLGLSSPGIRQ